MKYKLDVQNFGYAVELLTPDILEKLAEQVHDLTEDDLAVLNSLKEKLCMESDNGL